MSLMKLLRSLWNTLPVKELAIEAKTEVNMFVFGMQTLLSKRVLSYPIMSVVVGVPVVVTAPLE